MSTLHIHVTAPWRPQGTHRTPLDVDWRPGNVDALRREFDVECCGAADRVPDRRPAFQLAWYLFARPRPRTARPKRGAALGPANQG